MARNIEIKARIPAGGMAAVRERAARLASGPARVLRQTDTFFRVPRGRLKLRELDAEPAQLIFYERPDRPGPKASSYRVSPCPSPAPLRESLAAALGVRGVVAKRRELFLVGRTRIHLDRVEGLGTFLELEVVMREGQPDAEGEAVARELLRELGVEPGQLVAGAYIDLLERARTAPGSARESRPGPSPQRP